MCEFDTKMTINIEVFFLLQASCMRDTEVFHKDLVYRFIGVDLEPFLVVSIRLIFSISLLLEFRVALYGHQSVWRRRRKVRIGYRT